MIMVTDDYNIICDENSYDESVDLNDLDLDG